MHALALTGEIVIASMIGKILIFEREAAFLGRSVTMLLVKEKLGD